MDFQVFHKYRKLAAEGKAQPLLCPECHLSEMITRLGPNDSPVLECPGCGHGVIPGLKLYQQIQNVVKEHYLDG